MFYADQVWGNWAQPCCKALVWPINLTHKLHQCLISAEPQRDLKDPFGPDFFSLVLSPQRCTREVPFILQYLIYCLQPCWQILPFYPSGFILSFVLHCQSYCADLHQVDINSVCFWSALLCRARGCPGFYGLGKLHQRVHSIPQGKLLSYGPSSASGAGVCWARQWCQSLAVPSC